MNAFVIHIGRALLAAGAMAWQVGSTLVLGFVLRAFAAPRWTAHFTSSLENER